jgi:hypothetical protein
MVKVYVLLQEPLDQLIACHLHCGFDLTEKIVPFSLEGTAVTGLNLFQGLKKLLNLLLNLSYCYVDSGHSIQKFGAFYGIYSIYQALKNGLFPCFKFQFLQKVLISFRFKTFYYLFRFRFSDLRSLQLLRSSNL